MIQAGTEAIIWRRIDGILQHSSVNRQRHEIFIRQAQLNFQHVLLVRFSAPWLEFTGSFQTWSLSGEMFVKNIA